MKLIVRTPTVVLLTAEPGWKTRLKEAVRAQLGENACSIEVRATKSEWEKFPRITSTQIRRYRGKLKIPGPQRRLTIDLHAYGLVLQLLSDHPELGRLFENGLLKVQVELDHFKSGPVLAVHLDWRIVAQVEARAS